MEVTQPLQQLCNILKAIGESTEAIKQIQRDLGPILLIGLSYVYFESILIGRRNEQPIRIVKKLACHKFTLKIIKIICKETNDGDEILLTENSQENDNFLFTITCDNNTDAYKGRK